MKNKKNILFFGVIICVCFLHFYQALNNGFSIDDDFYIQQLTGIEGWKDLFDAFKYRFSVADYRPIATFTFVIEYILSGNQINPHVAHLVNLLLYILCAFILYLFIDKIPDQLKGKYVAEISTILFISLPLHTSMIANIKSRDGLVSFFLGFVYFYFFSKILLDKEKTWKNLLFFFIAIGAIMAAVFAKLDSFTFIIATPLLLLLFFEKINFKNIFKLGVVSIILFRAIDIIYQFWNDKKIESVPLQEDTLFDPTFFTENPIVDYNSLSYKISFAIQTVFEYIVMTLKPSGHYFYYGFDMVPVLPITDPIIWLKAIIIFTLIVVAVLLYKRNRLAGFGIIFFFAGLIYCSNFITPVSGIVADRYAFISSAGMCIGIASLLSYLMKALSENIAKKQSSSNSKKESVFKSDAIYFIPLVLISLFYLPFNIERCKEWSSRISLFDSDLPKITHKSYEANRIAVKNYVETAIDSDDLQFREKYFTKALNYGYNAMALYDDGQYIQDGIIMALYGLNNFDSAVAVSRKVIAKFDTTEIGWRMLTEYYNEKGYSDSAALGYKKLIQIMPEDNELYLFYASTLYKSNKKTEAYSYLDSLQKVNPDHYLPYRGKFYLYLEDKDSLNAMKNLEMAMERGWRDNKMLDIAGAYWWNRDRKKWEDLKRFIQ